MISTMTTNVAPRHRSRPDHLPLVCWCGQDLEHVRSSFCSRCGRASRSCSHHQGRGGVGLAVTLSTPHRSRGDDPGISIPS